jgi:tetratricopeptide (TPR) repeat protein
VAWIAELKNTLSAALFFGSILAWLVAQDGNRRWAYAGSLGLFIVAALSKGAVVTLPAVLLLCVLWRERKITWRGLVTLIPYAVIAIATAVITIRFQSRAPHYGGLLPDSPAYRFSRAGADIWFYLGALFWPAGLSPMRAPWLPDLHSPIAWLPAIAAVVVLALLLWKRRTWGRPLLFACGYYVLMLLPVLGFVWMALLQETPGTDWWQYLAAPGIFAVVAGVAATAARRWRFVTPLLAVTVAMLFVQTWRRASIYQDMETYCQAVTAEDPRAWTLDNNLGIMLKREGRYAESEACYRQALLDNPGYVEAHINLGNTLATAGDSAGAEREYRQAIQMRPGDAAGLQALANLLFAEGRLGAAPTR